MNQAINALNPQPDDLVVVPSDMEVPEGVPFMVHKMDYLHKPSIVRSGGFNMGFLDQFSFSNLAAWLGVQKQFMQRQSAGSEETSSVFQEVKPGAWLEPGGPQPEAGKEPAAEVSAVKTPPSLEEVLQNVQQARKEQSQEIAKFFRYSRPTETAKYLDGEKTVDAPRGGIAFYIELDPANKTFAFSYAICHNRDNFNYDIGRQISKGRFDSGDWHEVQNYDGSKSIVENITIAIFNELYNRSVDKTKEISFSSLSEKFSENDLREIYRKL